MSWSDLVNKTRTQTKNIFFHFSCIYAVRNPINYWLLTQKPFENPPENSEDPRRVSVGLGINCNLFEYVLTILEENKKK